MCVRGDGSGGGSSGRIPGTAACVTIRGPGALAEEVCQDICRARIRRPDVPELRASGLDLGRAASRGGATFPPILTRWTEISLFLFSKPHPCRIRAPTPPGPHLAIITPKALSPNKATVQLGLQPLDLRDTIWSVAVSLACPRPRSGTLTPGPLLLPVRHGGTWTAHMYPSPSAG